MKVILAAVISIDAKLTKHEEPNLHGWVSTEDQEHFKSLVETSDAIVFGSTTYDLMKDDLNLRPGKLRVILTSHPEKYAGQEVEGQLSFVNADPEHVVEILNVHNKQQLLVAGGPKIISDFLQAKLINEIYVTIEPRLFGTGTALTSPEDIDVELELIDMKQLNNKGTILAHYKVK